MEIVLRRSRPSSKGPYDNGLQVANLFYQYFEAQVEMPSSDTLSVASARHDGGWGGTLLSRGQAGSLYSPSVPCSLLVFSLPRFKLHLLSCALWISRRLAGDKGPGEKVAVGRAWTDLSWVPSPFWGGQDIVTGYKMLGTAWRETSLVCLCGSEEVEEVIQLSHRAGSVLCASSTAVTCWTTFWLIILCSWLVAR